MDSPVAEPRKSIVQYRDLREWLKAVDEMGELKHVGGVHWDREMCAMVDMVYRARGSGKAPALLFDDVPGYPNGYRCLYGMMASPRRFAFTIGGIDVTTARSSIEYLKQYRQRMKEIQFIPPVYVDRSPLFENVMEGDDVDLFKIPVPIHHELDVHRFNFGDITWWDRLFGTFREAGDFAPRCGFPDNHERKLGAMLMFKDVY